MRKPVLEVPRIWRGKNLYSGGYVSKQILLAEENYSVPNGGGSYMPAHAARRLSEPYCEARLPDQLPRERRYLVAGIDYRAESGTLHFPAALTGYVITLRYQYAAGGQPETAMQHLGLTLLSGQVGQPVWSHLATQVPDQATPYSGIAAVAGQDYDLGTSAQVENHTFEVIAPLAYTVGADVPDADPADFTADVLCNARYGALFPADRLANLQDWGTYCRAAGLLMSPALTEQTSAAEFLTTVCKLTNSWPVWSDGLLKIRPLGDTPLAANGRSHTPDTAPVYDLGDDDYLLAGPDEERVHITRRGQADVHNHIRLEWRNRANQYSLEIAEAKDRAHIQTYGLRSAEVVRAHWICDVDVAQRVVQLLLQRSIAVRNEYRFTLPWTKALLELGDLVTLTETEQGLERFPVRITAVAERPDGELDVQAEDFPLGAATAARYTSASGLGYAADYNVAPGGIDPPVIFEAPADLTATGIEVYAAVRGSGDHWGGCQVWVSLDGTRYRQTGVIYGGARYGRLSAPMTRTAGVQELGVGGSSSDAQALQTLCWVGPSAQEYFAYETAQLLAAGTYTLGGLVRGAYSTTTGAHQAGDRFVRVDDRIAKSGPIEAGLVGQTIHFKFPSFNVYGGALQDLAEVEAVPYRLTGAMAALRPGLAGKGVKLRANSLTFQYPKTGGVNPAAITLTAERKGTLTGAFTWQVVAGTAELQGNGDQRSVAALSMLTDSVTVRATVTDAVGTYSDEVTLVKVREGADGAPGSAGVPGVQGPQGANGVPGASGAPGAAAVSAVLSNEAAVFPADAAGTVTSYAGNTSTLGIFVGSTDDTANWTLSMAPSSGVTASRSGATVTVQALDQGTDAGYVDISAARSGVGVLTRRFSVSKSRSGAAGMPGAAGQQGPAGSPGATGATGPQGATGLQGAQGPSGATGAQGQRGNIEVSRAIAGSGWSDSEANAAISTSGYSGLVLLDRVTVYNAGVGYTETRYWSGSAWLTYAALVNGNLLVDGSVAAKSLAVRSITTDRIVVGAVTAASDATFSSNATACGSPGTSLTTGVTLVCTGAPVFVNGTVTINVTAANTTFARCLFQNVFLQRDGVDIHSVTSRIESAFSGSSGPSAQLRCDLHFRDSGATAGPHTYRLTFEFQLLNASGTNMTPNGGSWFFRAYLSAQENKV